MKATNKTLRRVGFDIFRCSSCGEFYCAPSPTCEENDATEDGPGPDQQEDWNCGDCKIPLEIVLLRNPIYPEANPFNDDFVRSDDREPPRPGRLKNGEPSLDSFVIDLESRIRALELLAFPVAVRTDVIPERLQPSTRLT